MNEEVNESNLSTQEKIANKVWKVRIEGYNELTDLIQKPDTNLEDVCHSYDFPMFLEDNNAVALEKALQLVLGFVKRYNGANISEEVVSKLIHKGLCSAMRKTTAEISKQIFKELCEKYGVLNMLGTVIVNYNELSNKRQDKIVNCISTMAVEGIGLINEYIEDSMQQANLLAILLSFYQHGNVKIRKDGLNGLSLLENFVDEENFENEILSKLKASQIKELDKVRKPRTSKKVKTWEERKGTDILNEEYINTPIFLQSLKSPDWKIRAEVLKDTLAKLQSLEKISYEKENYNQIFAALANVISKDVNLQIVQLSITLIDRIFELIKESGYISSYIPLVIAEELSRLKDKKLTEMIKTSVSKMVETHTERLDFFVPYFTKNLTDKLLAQRTECLTLFNDLLEKYSSSIKSIISLEAAKELLPVLIKFCKESQPNVRQQGFRVLALFFRYIPDAEDELIADVDKMLDSLKVKKIMELKDGYEGDRKRPATSPLKIEKIRKQIKTRANKAYMRELKEISRMSSFSTIPEQTSRVNSGTSISSFASFDDYYNNQLAQTTQIHNRVQNISRRLSSINLGRTERGL
ncbi:unnamed protein product [Hanseniaspora opuntiae]